MKTIIAGSRTITRHGLVRAAIVQSGWADAISEVVSGGARGADRLGEVWAREKGVPVRLFPADWDTHGKAAGLLRNEQMATYADALIAVWDGTSRGTADMIERAHQYGLKVYVHRETKPMKIEPLPTIIEEPDDLFALTTHTCADCGQSFESSRRNRYCALCASLRAGQVGPATVQCPACGLTHKVSVLAAHKLCGPCQADLVLTEQALRTRLAAADAAYTEAWARLDADLAHADEKDQQRYAAALAQEDGWGPERFARNVAAAIERGDGLSPLLRALLAMRAANDAAGVVAAEVWQGLAEVEKARQG